MKLKILVMVVLCNLSLHASLWKINDASTENRFLGLGIKVCSTVDVGDQKAYDAGNDTISSLLNLNFLDPALLGQQFYMLNDFMNWLGKDNHKNPSNGYFIIIIGTSKYLQQMVAPNIACPDGKQLLCAQLKCDNGKSIETWSQDSICLAPGDRFSLKISCDQDTTITLPPVTDDTTSSMQVDAQGMVIMKEVGPGDSYPLADKSPRTIRLIKADN